MPRLGYAVVCRSPLLDPFTQALTCAGIVDAVTCPPWESEGAPPEELKDVKYVLHPLFVCTQWFILHGETLEQEFEQQIRMWAPDERETEVPELLAFSFKLPYHRVLHLVPTVGLRLSGIHEIRVYIRAKTEANDAEWEQQGAFPFWVIPQEDLKRLANDDPGEPLVDAVAVG